MLISLLQLNLPFTKILGIALLMVIGILLALICHEVAHALVALALGDPTAKNEGRISLDPRNHLDPVGALMLLLIGYGWAKPVAVNPRNFKRPRLGMALTALAGPLMNLLLALVATLARCAFYRFCPEQVSVSDYSTFASICDLALSLFASLNIGLAVFNLIPLPPLDGSNIVASILPPSAAAKYLQVRFYTRYIFLGLIILSVLSNYSTIASWIYEAIWFPFDFLRSALAQGFLSFGELIFGLS